MGEGETKRAWLSDLRKYVSDISSAIPVEAIILYGSAARNLNGSWSDIDVLVISDAFRGIPIPDRISLLLRFKRGRIEALGYTFDELVRMVNAMNPLALNALIEGRIIVGSDRVRKLAEETRKRFIRRGRAWFMIPG
ncbi:nucleotidyltransferase domain-containing protein [Vulcanisaeta distributa]|uniref:DNA polymerase beta domain protein region n=1 Tax=Vulcanisaeta distributa (strain DSM 14429 / JCM 11212 / NBRC 100878 / IC-017) TaxID=572478 RepID=E1QUI5_VULDI|nr:nucleotidyltransferase domain-containing protein [Vulcanisaeta distributa]ADN49911.1 DNA polymerase beta domain protein region [Vulcanisaeta distributa DSM 14429]